MVVVFIAGIHELVQRELRSLVFTAIGLSALAFGVWVYRKFSLFFYFGRPRVGELVHRLTFNQPAFVGEGFVWLLVLLIGASLAGFAAALWRGRREPDAEIAAP